MGKNIPLINDLPGHGKVALSHMGHHLCNLPTTLASNTPGYGRFTILATTDYMRRPAAVWKQRGFSFDAVSTGFVVFIEQVRLTAQFRREQSARGARLSVDSIMGDEGRLYNGGAAQTARCMRDLDAVAEIIRRNRDNADKFKGIPPESRLERLDQ